VCVCAYVQSMAYKHGRLSGPMMRKYVEDNIKQQRRARRVVADRTKDSAKLLKATSIMYVPACGAKEQLWTRTACVYIRSKMR
jgi:hypothetical protein